MVHVIRPRPFNVMWERNALPYGVVCADEFTCGAPRSAHPTGYRVPRLFNPQNICYNETIRYFEVEIVLLHTLRVKRNAGQGTPVKIPEQGTLRW